MGRLKEVFDRARSEQRAVVIVYLCGGDPSLEATGELLIAAGEGGADILELGMPFSDPTADGATIQRASERALRRGTTLKGVLEVARKVRSQSAVPMILFGYYNPIFVYGEERLVEDARNAGIDGLLVVDLPPEACAPLREPAVSSGLDYVPLVAPNSGPARVSLAANAASSFLYYVSLTGVTGAKAARLEEAACRAESIRKDTGRPVAVGFGIKTPEDVKIVASKADGVVIGSAVVDVIEKAKGGGSAAQRVRDLVRSLRMAATKDSEGRS